MLKVDIDFLCVVLGQACNLKCKDCGAMAPYAPLEFYRYDIDEIITDLSNITKFGRINLLQIQGGEPFLHSDIKKILDFINETDSILNTIIATNGTIIPSENIIETIKKIGATIRISNYPIVKNKAIETWRYLEKQGVNVQLYEFTSGQSLWYYKGIYEMKRTDNDADVNKRFLSCRNNGCLTLERHTLSYCTRAANSHVIQGFDAPENDFLLVTGEDSFENKLKDYLNNRHFMEACRYCYGTDENYIVEPAIQLTRTE